MTNKQIVEYRDGMTLKYINNKQIDCGLTKDLLSNLNLRISELSQKNNKTVKLFECITNRAKKDFDFIMEKKPIKVDAKPLNDKTIILSLSLIDDKTEIDKRYTKFAPYY